MKIILSRSWPSYTFNIIADEPTTQPSFTAASSVGNNQMDLNFSGGNGTSYMVVMRQGSAVTATPTDATSYSTVSGSVNFSSATELSAGQKIVYNGVISGNSVTVTNLSAGTDYYYAIYAYNGTGTLANFYTTSAGTGNQTTTGSSNSAVSDIIIHASFTEPSNIDYAATQENSNLTVGTSVEVAKFTLRDGGATTDADANTTILNAITFTIANHANLRRLALYDGSTELSEVAISTGTATFSSLTLSAADNDSKDFSLRASFAGTVTDNIQFSFTVSSATADVAGSTFAAADAGAAASSTTGDRNKIEVTADRLAFVVQPSNVSVNVAINPSVTVSANDVNSNRDLDYVTDMTASTTGTFAGASTNTITPSAGLGTFSNLQFSVAAAARTIAVSSGSLTASGNSSTFDITASIETGDIAFVKYQSDAPDEFSIITFVDIPANQTFYFTDNQYTTASGPLATNEQTMTWTTPGTVITAGTVITFSNSSGALTTVTPSGNGTGTNALNGISASGDQIFMYKGTSGSPTQYICGLNFGNSGAWQTSVGLSTNTSFLPTDLTDNVTGISFSSDLDNGYYSNTQSGSISTIKALVNNGANWTRNDNLQTPPTWSFTINATSTTVTANTTVHNLSLASGETFVIGANTLTINGAVSGSGTLTGGSTSNLTIGGTAGTLSFTNGSRTLNNLIIGTGNTASITLGSALDITSTGGITFNAAGTKSFTTTGQTLTLKSDVTGTANLGNLNSTTITGNVTVERYIPSSTRRYRFLSSPVATDVADWRGEIFITGGGVSSDFSSVGTNNVKSNGLDWTLSGAPSMYAYTENLNSGSLNSRWEAITNGSTTLTAGKGYRVFVRGDRSNAGVLDNSVTSQSAVTINATGAINTGTQTLPVTYNGSTSDDGWNLVGNPYPSNIDWNAVSGWTKTNVSGTIWIYNPTNNTYGNWDGVTTTNGVTRNVSSGQAFFVRTTGSPVLSCTESVKVANAGASIFKTIEENTLRIGLVKDSSNSDETVIRFMEGKKDEFNDQDDVRKFINSTVNVSSNFGLDKYASVNYLDPKNLTNKVVPISAWVDENGTYQLNFNGMSSFNSTPYVLLKDKFLNKIVDLRTSNIYQFAITNDTKTKDDNRFEVIFSDKSTGLNESNSITNTNLSVYPNPATDVLNISLLNGTTIEAVNIYNVSGKLVNNTKLSENQIDISQLNNGVYIIEVITANGSFKTKFVK